MSLYDDYINSVSKKHCVGFRARKGVPGHAFVNLRASLNSDLAIDVAIFGLYPDEGKKLAAVKSLLTPVSGVLAYTLDDVEWDIEFKIAVSEEQTKVVITQLNKWTQNTPAYSLLANNGLNCNALTAEVAKILGLKSPVSAGTSLPWFFMEELFKLNTK